jgi:FHS family L-fucose permease-like MFS transporter
VLLDYQGQIAAKQNASQTPDIQNFEYAKKNGYTGSFQDFQNSGKNQLSAAQTNSTVNAIAGHAVTDFYPYLGLVLVLIAADKISEGNPIKQLLMYSLLGIVALLVGIFASGMISVFAFMSVGLFCSTLWPCIFTLGIAGLGSRTNTGSSLLIMMIMGGGFISVAQGALSDDAYLGIQYSYFVGVACFAYLAFYAYRVKGILKKQNIQIGEMAGGH